MAQPEIITEKSESGTVFHLTGRMVTDVLHLIEKPFAQIAVSGDKAVFDLSKVEALDTAGACLIARKRRELARTGTVLELAGATPDRLRLIEKVAESVFPDQPDAKSSRSFTDWLTELGRQTVAGVKSMQSLLGFMGLVISRMLRSIVKPRRIRVTALFAQMQQTGYNAVPIIALMGFLIGIVLAYQGAAQLQQFGAEVFVVDLIAVSVLRELGILLTAIIVAGRSGSAYAAAIGSMKVNEEVDAMRTLGLDPIEVLVLPRVIALVLMLPVLGLVANACALIGGALMSWMELGVSPSMFVTRFVENTDVWHLAVGMIKAPVFAFIIALVACWQGFQVSGSAESVGQRTRSSVVQAIFLVIVMDAVFSIFFAELGV